MERNMKSKIVASLLAGAIMAGPVAVSAASSWEFSGYDTTTPPAYGKIYNEVVDGYYTNKVVIDPVAEENVEWKSEGFELAYPHAGYERLYLEGNAQQITRYNGQLPQWETKFVDYMWEVCGEHRIYQRQQTNIPNVGWRWDYGNEAFGIDDSEVFVPTTRNAVTEDSFKPFGVAAFDMNGNFVSDAVKNLYANSAIGDFDKGLVASYLNADGTYKLGVFDVYSENVVLNEGTPEEVVVAMPTKSIVDYSFFSDENLSMLDANGHYVVSDEELAQKVGLIASKFVTGPSYYGENPTKDVAGMYVDLVNKGNNPNAWYWDNDTLVHEWADISWTAVQYEMEEPYNYYQYLVVNGLVFDGRNDLPRVFRYTGGVASPKVEWKYQWSEKDYPYNVVEFKYVDGKLALDREGQPIYRYPSGEFAKIYTKVTDTEIQLWVKDNFGGNVMVQAISRVDANFGGGLIGYAPAANFVVK